jgi:nucleotide-binding universal stress UspA family protein
MKHILVAVDGSDGSKGAAHWAARLAARADAKLTLLLVLDPPHVVSIAPLEAFAVTKGKTPPESIAKAKEVLARIQHELPAGQADTLVEIGRPADVILETAQKLGVDHLVVGARGLNAGERWLVGSVSDRVVHHAHCPVTVVR